ncbi:hypothetical protein [Streptomyces sp. Rer75]|uniref:hypothetical protein n=1 Tax=unclassified Streptomyces TaxID=2593676 RepID=UPI0015CFFAB2|nr:hypothetical protein [Streptomyces sp. Rer75]QLH22579.1 hypothetical protein HYQ63_19795 [Streptomyces sp. Rer75]
MSYYRQMYYSQPSGTTEQPNSEAITTGVSETKGEEFSKRTSVSVTVSAGIELKAFSASVETSVTHELGYTSRTDVTQFQERTQNWGMTTPPRSTTVLWSPRHEIRPIRANGDIVGGQSGLVFDVEERVLTEYPGGQGAKVFVDGVETTVEDLKAAQFQTTIDTAVGPEGQEA